MENKLRSASRRKMMKQLGILGIASCLPISLLAESNQMIERRIPSSGELLPIVGLGTWQTFDVGNTSELRAPLKAVLESMLACGGSLVDSSPMYGRSEQVVGDLAEELNVHQKLFKATKVWTSGREAGIRQMEQSMNRMKTQKMDLMQVHNLVDWQTHLKTLRAWKDQGKVRYIGITHYLESAYGKIATILEKEQIDFLQINYSMSSRLVEKKLLPLAKEKGVAVIINRPYEGGSLFRKIKGKQLPNWISEIDCKTWGQFFLKYLLGNSAVNCVIPGTSKAKHVLDNMQAGHGNLPTEKQRIRMLTYLQSL